jgi:diguanylate cyclase (GGDEF)-like protein/PAS domain S-box-containing protein
MPTFRLSALLRHRVPPIRLPGFISMFGSVFSPANNYAQGLTTKRAILVAVLGGVVVALFAACAFAVRPLWLKSLLLLLASIAPAALVRWFSYFLSFYTKAYDKSTTLLRRARKRIGYLESILQDSTDIIFTVDTDGFILKFNNGAQIHFGYTQEEIVGRPLSQLFVNEADERKILCSVLLSGKSVNEEISMKTKAGEIILLDISMSEMKNEKGEIIGMVITAKDITEKKKLELELRKKNELLSRLAITDSLTDLFNVRHFYSQIKRELSRLRRNPDRRLSLIMLDIDHFKELNDTEGHQVGDQVLRSLSQVITVCIRRDVDSAFRYGGDEFVIILPDTDKVHARIVAERIQKQFGAFKFGRATLSIGITEAQPEESEETLVKRCDEAMYESKRSGRARVSTA